MRSFSRNNQCVALRYYDGCRPASGRTDANTRRACRSSVAARDAALQRFITARVATICSSRKARTVAAMSRCDELRRAAAIQTA